MIKWSYQSAPWKTLARLAWVKKFKEECKKMAKIIKGKKKARKNAWEGKKLALLSVYYKEGIVDFALALKRLGYTIVSSGGTAKHLKENGVMGVIDVARITGLKPILDHRVVTLHPKIHGGILAKNTVYHTKERKKYGIPRFGIICVDLYPVLEAIAAPKPTIESVMEKTDIGGPTMIRGAAKNHDHGIVVICDPADRQRVIAELENSGEVSEKLRLELAYKVFNLMARYDAAISKFLAKEMGLGVEAIFLSEVRKLAYAENKCQNPAHHFAVDDDDPLALHKFKVDAGDPSYTALADANGILEIMCTLAESFRRFDPHIVPFIAIAGKHGNPCGAAIDWSDPKEAIEKALLGDKVAVLGGEVITNFPITDELGQVLYAPASHIDIGRPKWGLDLVVAPEFSDTTIKLLGQKEKRRLLSNPNLNSPKLPKTEWIWKPVRGGFLRQRQYPFILTPDSVKEWIGAPLTNDDFATLLIAWAICWKASSNTVALANDNMLIGLGCGQQDRIACVRLCLERANRAGHDTHGSFFASDGFFPFARSQAPDINELIKLTRELVQAADNAHAQLKPSQPNPRQAMRILAKAGSDISRLDIREGTELLIDAGCLGGVVPADGQKLPEVQELFKQAGLSVAFVAPEFRGFAKH